ncbi:MAG: hypothetical protein U1U88_000697 [Lawsonella clevelandensis]
MSTPQPVLVVDFGAQYSQLIARRIREAKIYSEVIPHTATLAEFQAKNPAAIVLSGGPASVYADGAPTMDPAVLRDGCPRLWYLLRLPVPCQEPRRSGVQHW